MVAIATLLLVGALAGAARAEVVRMPNGRLGGVTPVAGINPTTLHGSQAAPAALAGLSSNGNLDYHGGPVLHAVSPYVIFWDPAGAIPAGQRTLIEQYFADVAADSGGSSNVFGVDRQFTDSTGFANYSQTWAASHIIIDTQAYPTTGNCTDSPVYGESVCLYDSQLQTEITRLITAGSLPTGTNGNAPIYFVVTPPSVNSCFPDSPSDDCADNSFCAYHSSYVTGGQTVLYADIPMVLAANDPKSCQYDGQSAVQSPNGHAVADVAIKYLSHEFNETITDPLGNAWYDTNSGNEDGDNCNFYGSNNPQGGSSPNAFLPTLGGSAGAGTLYDQVINGDHYYTQTEWSNGDVGCEAEPSNGSISAAFSAPAAAAPGASVTFDPTSSSSTGGWTSATWAFGDGSSSFHTIGTTPGTTTHTFAAAGNYTVTLTLVDGHGDISTVTHQISISTASAAFSSSPAHPLAGAPVSFDASGSSTNTGSIVSYAWNFGDGATDTTSSATDSHTYAASGTYTVQLTVTDSNGHTASISHSVTIDGPPVAAFAASSGIQTTDSLVAFNAAGSSTTAGSISSYAWNFGDGSTDTTSYSTVSHGYSRPGTYSVALTVTDSDGHTDQISHSVVIAVPPRAAFRVAGSLRTVGAPISFDASSSRAGSTAIRSYRWDFGDGVTGSGARATHTYSRAGLFTVRLTVTDADGTSSSTSQTVQVSAASIGGVRLSGGSRVETLTIALTGPGTLRLGSAHVTVRRARTVKLGLKLSRSQQATLGRTHHLTIHVTLRFSPRGGRTIVKRYAIKLSLL